MIPNLTSSTMAVNPSYTLIVFGGNWSDLALATDFVAISKKFMADGLDHTCLSGTDLYITTLTYGPLLFGRDDLRKRTEVYNVTEATNPFYRLVGAEGLKEPIIRWIRNVSHRAKAGDRIIIVLIGHGQTDTANVVLNSRYGKKYLTKTEISASLSTLPDNVLIMLVNEACFSGSWAPIAIDVVGTSWSRQPRGSASAVTTFAPPQTSLAVRYSHVHMWKNLKHIQRVGLYDTAYTSEKK